jgi:pimeloyl-ACP methyl ester carboxylesterase
LSGRDVIGRVNIGGIDFLTRHETVDIDRPGALLSGYYYPTLRVDALMTLPGAIPVVGDLMNYTVAPLLGAALLPSLFKGMFATAPRRPPIYLRFAARIVGTTRTDKGESQDGSTMVPAAAALMPRYGELRLPVAIIAGIKDRVVGVERHAVRLHSEMPQSTLHLVPDVGHMVHYAVPEQITEAIENIADQLSFVRRTFDDRDCVKGVANVT